MKTHMILPPLHPPVWSVTLWVEIHCQPSRASAPMFLSSASKKVSIATFTASRTAGSGTLWPLLGSSCCQGCQGGSLGSSWLLQRVLNIVFGINLRFCIYPFRHFSGLHFQTLKTELRTIHFSLSLRKPLPVFLPTLLSISVLTWAPCPGLSACTTPPRSDS